MARGLDDLTTSPFIDRTLLRARDPPSPKFHHIEHQPAPKLVTTGSPRSAITAATATATSSCIFKITRDQINALKGNQSTCNKEDGKTTTKTYTSFEILSGHIWRYVCNTRGLSDTTQASKLYFGNAIFSATLVALAKDLVSRPTSYAANMIQEFVARMDDEYLRSAIDYIELQPDKDVLVPGPHTFGCPNLIISPWTRLRVYDADFRWGPPTYMGPSTTNSQPTNSPDYLEPLVAEEPTSLNPVSQGDNIADYSPSPIPPSFDPVPPHDEASPPLPPVSPPRASTRTKKPPGWLQDFVCIAPSSSTTLSSSLAGSEAE
ncbi:hypothetical protein V2J09_020462 [Rumex salicifolius]